MNENLLGIGLNMSMDFAHSPLNPSSSIIHRLNKTRDNSVEVRFIKSAKSSYVIQDSRRLCSHHGRYVSSKCCYCRSTTVRPKASGYVARLN